MKTKTEEDGTAKTPSANEMVDAGIRKIDERAKGFGSGFYAYRAGALQEALVSALLAMQAGPEAVQRCLADWAVVAETRPAAVAIQPLAA